MTLTRFARMCEALESQTPTRKCFTINESLSSFDNVEDVVEILAIEYPNNNPNTYPENQINKVSFLILLVFILSFRCL